MAYSKCRTNVTFGSDLQIHGTLQMPNEGQFRISLVSLQYFQCLSFNQGVDFLTWSTLVIDRRPSDLDVTSLNIPGDGILTVFQILQFQIVQLGSISQMDVFRCTEYQEYTNDANYPNNDTE